MLTQNKNNSKQNITNSIIIINRQLQNYNAEFKENTIFWILSMYISYFY